MTIAKQFGFATGAGAIQNIADHNDATFWAPLATGLDTITDQFLTSDGTSLNYAGSFAALEYDFGRDVRATSILIKVETLLTLGAAVLIGSDNPATSVADTCQTGDVLLAQYTQAQMVASKVLEITATKAVDLRFRYYRILQRSSAAAAAPPIPGSGPSGPFTQFDSSAGNFTTPTYSGTFTIEGWGGGASGGVTGNANAGGDTEVSKDSLFDLIAHGGHKATTSAANSGTGAGTGGTATGANTFNVTGGNAGVPSPTTTGGGTSGKGGDAPVGGLGGSPVSNSDTMIRYGINGAAPGGGGSGRNLSTSIAGGTYFKYPGGGTGAYFKHVLTRGIDGPEPGDVIAWSVGAGGVSPIGDGNGANGRVRFSWT
jgi:hypothetical protein